MSRPRKTPASSDERSEKRFPTAAEITRALGAAQKLNLPVMGFTVHPDGSLHIHTSKPPEPAAPTTTDRHTR